MDKSLKILSDITVHMKYAKYIKEKKRRETWNELVKRTKDMHKKKYPALALEVETNFNNFVETKLILPSMRSLQFAGKPIEISPNRLYNCCYAPIDNYKVFSEVMFLLLGGSGFGYSIQKKHIEKLPEIKKTGKKRRYLIGDSITGWADAVNVLIKAYLKGTSLPEFDFSDIREKGALLITSGGKAPGAEPLKTALFQIQKILDRKSIGDKLTSLEVHDIVCHIADSVLSGGIRRASLISLFDIDDEDMLTCKFGAWYEAEPQRGRANNSAVLLRHKITHGDFVNLWSKIRASGSGEPGFYLSNNADWCCNPCVTGDTLVLTKEGDIPIVEICNKEIEIWNGFEWSKVTPKITGYDQPTLLIKFSNNKELKCTDYHKFVLASGDRLEARNLEVGMNLLPYRLTTDSDFQFIRVEEIKRLPNSEVVYCFTEPKRNLGVFNGVLTGQCVEIALKPFQFCNLIEVNVSNLQSQEDLDNRVTAGAFIGTLQAGYTDFHYLRDIWKRTTEKDSLLGISMTGIASGEVLRYDLDRSADKAIQENKRVASLIGINSAARITCVKPAGTTSLVLGCSSGVHAWHSPYYIRRIRVGKDESIYAYLKNKCPSLVEDEFFKPTKQAVINIPIKAPKNAIFRTESAIDLLERVKTISSTWIKTGHIKGDNSHNVSATVSIKENEWDIVRDWMWVNRDYYNGLAVLPYDGGTYIQAPFEEITEEKYNEMYNSLEDIDLSQVIEYDDNTDIAGEIACSGGSCELK